MLNVTVISVWGYLNGYHLNHGYPVIYPNVLYFVFPC